MRRRGDVYGAVDPQINPLLTSVSSHFLMIMSFSWENGLFFCDRGSLSGMISIL